MGVKKIFENNLDYIFKTSVSIHNKIHQQLLLYKWISTDTEPCIWFLKIKKINISSRIILFGLYFRKLSIICLISSDVPYIYFNKESLTGENLVSCQNLRLKLL